MLKPLRRRELCSLPKSVAMAGFTVLASSDPGIPPHRLAS